MNGRKRFTRRPGITVLWLAALTAAALLLAVGGGVLWSVMGLERHLDEQFTSIAVLTRTQEEQQALEEAKEYGWNGVVQDAPTLTQEELEQLEAMEQVRLVDLRGLTAAYSPDLVPVLSVETEKAYQMELDRPYGHVMLVGRVLQAETERKQREMDTTEMDGQVHRYTEVATTGTMVVEQVLAAHADYEIPEELEFDVYYVSEDPDDVVRAGERYLFYGEFDAGLTYDLVDYLLESGGEEPPVTPLFHVNRKEGAVACYLEEDGSYRYVSSADVPPCFPLYSEISGSVEEFLAAPEQEQWRRTLEEMQITMHSLPLLGTDCLESVYTFQQGSSYLLQGRSFTQQEYRSGARVCVISEAVAQKAGLSVGDSLTISQYEPLVNYDEYCSLMPNGQTSRLLQHLSSVQLNDPFIRPYLSQYGFSTSEESFTVVGIYRQEDWWDEEGAYAMTPNVIFTTSGALADSAYRADAGGVYLSVVLENGMAQEFEQALEGTGLEGRWLIDDQNYDSVKAGVEQLKQTALILMAACAAGWLVVALFYLILCQGGERRNLGIMISVGAGRGSALRYLWGSGLILAAAGTVLGAALGRVVDRSVLDMVMSVSMEQATSTAMSSGVQVDTALITQTLTESGALSWQGTVLIAAVSVAVLAAAMLVQALVLVKRRPRKLMEG